MWGPGQTHGHGVLSTPQVWRDKDYTWLQLPAGTVGQAHLGRGVDFVHVAQDGVVLQGRRRHWGWKGMGMALQEGSTEFPAPEHVCVCLDGYGGTSVCLPSTFFGEISMLSPRVLHSLHGGSREALWDRQPLHSCSPNPPQTWREGSRCPGAGLFIKLFVSRAAARPVYLSG